MKLHLPVRLFRSVMAVMAVTPVVFSSAFAADNLSSQKLVDADLVLESQSTSITGGDVIVTSEVDAEGNPLFSFKLQNNQYLPNSSEDNLLKLTSFEANGLKIVDITGNKINKEDESVYPDLRNGFLHSATATRFTDNVAVNVCNNSIEYTAVERAVEGAALGGTVYFDGNTTIIHNENKAIVESVRRAVARGGVMHGIGIHYTGNGNIDILNNGVSASASASINDLSGNPNTAVTAEGGAFYTLGGFATEGYGVSFDNNGKIHISGNYAEINFTEYVKTATVRGGAIFASTGKIHIRNNDDVIFEKNYIVKNGEYELQSIYAEDGSSRQYTQSVEFSAAAGKKIEFRDSLYADVDLKGTHHSKGPYASSFDLNSQYTDSEGVAIAQTGDIILTGEYAEQHLNEILATRGEKRTATAEEILASQTSEVVGTATLHDGRLIIKEGAVLNAGAIEVLSSASGESTPSLVLQNATLSADSLTFKKGTSLVLNNVDNSSDAMISVSTSLTMSDSVVLALSGAYTGDVLKIAVADYTGSASDWFTEQASTTITVDSLLWNADDLALTEENGTLYVTGSTQKKDVLDISNSNMLLDSETALGTDIPVVSTGTTTLDTAENVTVILPGTIQNGGDLTISGSYDASKLVEITVEDTRVSVYGKEGNNGFFREGGKALVVVDNKGNATLAVTDGTTVQGKDGESLKLYASGLATSKELDYSNYQIADGDHKASMSDIQGMRPDSAESLTITMSNGTLVADEDAADIQASGGTIETKGDVTVGGKLAGTTSVVVGEGSATISGEHDYTGDTIISRENAKLTVGHDKALGKSKVQLHNKGTLDLNGKAVSNYLNVTGCELHNASAYTGTMDVSGDLTICGTDATADTVNMVKGGSISAYDTETLTVNTLTVSGGDSSINADLIINPDGRIVLNDGSVLTVNSTVTLGDGASIVLNGDYASGDTIMVVKDGINTTEGSVTLSYGYGRYIVVGDVVKLSAVFNQNKATACTLTNWGIATASRAVVNAVRGQRSNTGCIANGKGTAWVASLGSKHEINGSDIDISGAAVGADMQVCRNSRVGIALGYAEGEVQPAGLRQVDQEGSYLAVYGEHGLKKLSATSCLSMDWVAAYGVTDSEVAGLKWEQDSVQLNSRVNWNKKVTDKLCMSVFGGLEYFANNSDTVDGVKTGSIQNLRGEIGVGARYVAWGTPASSASFDEKGAMVTESRPGCEKLVLNGEVRYMNDMVRSNPVIRMNGLSGMGDNPGRQGIGIEAGATYRIGERWSASANYGFNTMEDSKEHRLNIGAAYTF